MDAGQCPLLVLQEAFHLRCPFLRHLVFPSKLQNSGARES